MPKTPRKHFVLTEDKIPQLVRVLSREIQELQEVLSKDAKQCKVQFDGLLVLQRKSATREWVREEDPRLRHL